MACCRRGQCSGFLFAVSWKSIVVLLRIALARAEGEEPAIAVHHDTFAGVPGRVAKGSRELDAAGGVLDVQRVDVLNEQLGVEQLVSVLVGIECGRLRETEMDSVLVACDDGVGGRVRPRAETFERKLVPVIGEGRTQVSREELRRDLADHRAQYISAGAVPGWRR